MESTLETTIEEPQVEGVESPAAAGDSTEEQRRRGDYKQYEDPQVVIEKIRFYRTQRFPDSEIMKRLDNMPRRTYYNYVKKLQEQDMEILDHWAVQNREQVAEDFVIYRENLCNKLRELQAIIDKKETPAKDKLKAIEQYIELSGKLMGLNRAADWHIADAERTHFEIQSRRRSNKIMEEIRRANQTEAS